jgi:hypothetical protein
MPRISSISLHALTWLCLAACPTCHAGDGSGKEAAAAKQAPAKQDPAKPDPAATGPIVPPPPEGGFTEADPPSDAVPGLTPAWFSPDAFEHTAIIRQDLAGTPVPTGQTSAMIVLELPAATTPEQCIEQFRAKLAETVKDPPIASTMPQGHLSLRGKGDDYEYTVVCGMAKDKPTMFLSYSQ